MPISGNRDEYSVLRNMVNRESTEQKYNVCILTETYSCHKLIRITLLVEEYEENNGTKWEL